MRMLDQYATYREHPAMSLTTQAIVFSIRDVLVACIAPASELHGISASCWKRDLHGHPSPWSSALLASCHIEGDCSPPCSQEQRVGRELAARAINEDI